MNPRKILVIRTDRIGDVILTLPMVDALKTNFPQAQIDFLLNVRVAELLDDYPNINKVHSIEKDTIKVIKRICLASEYDIAIIVHPTFRIAFAVFLARTKYRVGTGYRWYSFLFNIKHFQHRKYSEKHEVEYNLDLLKALNCILPEHPVPFLRVDENSISSLREKAEIRGLDLTSSYIIIHPGSLGSAKTWGESNFIALISLLLSEKEFNYSIVLTGSVDEKLLTDSILQTIQNSDKVFGFNDLSLKELAALIKFSKMFISNSTGPIHVAAAVGTFVVGFYPSKIVESATRWAPYTNKKKIFSGKSDLGSAYLSDVDPLDVFNFTKSYLNK